MENYIKLKNKHIFSVSFAYLDTDGYLADELFIKHKVHVKYGKEFAGKGSDYRVIFCKVKKSDEQNFLKAIHELKNKMLLMGHTDYEQAYGSLFGDKLKAWKEK